MKRAAVVIWREALRDSDATWRAKLVGYVLATYLPSRGVTFAYPALDSLASGGGVSVRTAWNGVRDLEAAGFAEVSRSKGRSSHRYYATLPVSVSERLRAEWEAATRHDSPATRHDSPATRHDVPTNRATAKHDARPARGGRAVCHECETGGGEHVDGCSRATRNGTP